MQVEIWSDVICPWCYIGKRRFETALADFAQLESVNVIWRSFELDTNARCSTRARWRRCCHANTVSASNKRRR